MKNRVNHIKTIINELRSTVNKQTLSKLEIDKYERIVEKLAIFSTSCEDCQQHLLELHNHFIQLKEKVDRMDDIEFKQHKQFINDIVSHLEKQHKLVSEGYYLSIYMSLGMSIGVALGLTVFDNIGLGIPIGMCIGLAIGSGLDADAKKKGKTI